MKTFKAKILPEYEELVSLFTCDFDKGILRTKQKKSARYKYGDEVGWTDCYGYRIVSIKRKNYRVHRIIYKMYYKSFNESLTIDHINGNPLDNRICNLEAKTLQLNALNKRIPDRNTSGVCGVYWHKTNKSWAAEIMLNRQKFWIGCFDDFGEAVAARKEAEKSLGFHPNHGRI